MVLAWGRGDAFPHGASLVWGLVAGVMAGVSLACFYVALSRGAMGASAALSGLLAAAIPAAVSSGDEGSPGLLRMVGFVVAGVAIWLIAAGENPEAKTAGPGDGLAGGAWRGGVWGLFCRAEDCRSGRGDLAAGYGEDGESGGVFADWWRGWVSGWGG